MQNSFSLQDEAKWALDYLDRGAFTKMKPSRFISGTALSGWGRDYHTSGWQIHARGVQASLPRPLLLEHNFARPLGLVRRIECKGDKLLFTAEIANQPSWLEPIWEEIKAENLFCVSMLVTGKEEPARSGIYRRSNLIELSVVETGKDLGASVSSCWERSNVVKLHGPFSSGVMYHWGGPSK